MKYLLDTHILLWCLADSPQLSKEARAIIVDPQNLIFVSAASAWEIAIKKMLGKLEAPDNLSEVVSKTDFQQLQVTFDHIESLLKLPFHHHDPFDRVLVAQAIHESLTIITVDHKIADYQVPTFMALQALDSPDKSS